MKKTTKLLTFILVLGMMIGVFAAFSITASAAPSQVTDKYDLNGDGIKDSVYEIRTVDDFIWYCSNATYENRINGVLINDIDLSSVCSLELGSWSAPKRLYLGIFDGNGKTIKNLYINTPDEAYKGLFGQVYEGTIQNLTVTGSIIAKEAAGGFIGSGDVSIYNSVNYVDVTVTERQGAGFIGYQSSNSVVDGCINYGNITHTGTNTANIAGIVANFYGKVYNCVNYGTIYTEHGSLIAGIAGEGYPSGTYVENCINLGTVRANNGGTASEIVHKCTEVSDCYYKADAKNNGVYKYSGATVNNVKSFSATELANGEVAYQLGEGWGQEIGVDEAPVFGGMKIYYTIDPSTLCTADEPTYYYANSENTRVTHDENVPAENYVDGICTICGGYQPAVDTDGDGNVEIGNVGQLYWFANEVNSGNVGINAELTNNITVNENVLSASGDLNGDPSSFRAWIPIGTSSNRFEGSFLGNGYVISGLYAKDYGVGFFRYLGDSSKVSNLGVMDSYFENTGYVSGALVGYMTGYSIVVENCFSNATIAGESYSSGGLFGCTNVYVTVRNCYYFGKTVAAPFANSDFSWSSGSGGNYYVSSVDDNCDYTTAITMNDVTSGKLAYMLGGAYGQNIDGDGAVQSYPVISDAKVYYGYTTCDESQTAPIYTNLNTASAEKPAHSNFVYAVNGSEITKHCGECNKLMGTVTVVATGGKYKGLPISASVNGTGDYSGVSFTITYTDAEGNGTTTAPTAIGSYTASISVEGNTASADFVISTGSMKVLIAPTATHEYGDTHLDKLISGKVVAEGNDALEITGTWNWVADTTAATFTPDPKFVDLFEGLGAQREVTITVTAATPTVSLTSPSPSIMPDMSIIFDIEFANPHTDAPESLPTDFRYVYTIGQNGELNYSTGSKFTIPSSVSLGETVYVYVENIAVDGKYKAGRSNTVALAVGQVDYTEAIEESAAELRALVAEKADKTTIDAAIERLENLISNAEAAAKAYADDMDAALKAELNTTIDSAKTELVNGYTAAVNAAKEELNAAIILKADTATLNEKVEALNSAIEAAETAAKTYADDLDQALRTKLDSDITAAKNAATKYTDEVLNIAKEELNNAIVEGDKALDEKIASLATALENARLALEEADKANKESLEQQIRSAEDSLKIAINRVAYDLEQAEKKLENAIKSGDKALDDKIAELSAALESARLALEAADKADREALESAIADGDKTLDGAIKKVAADLAALDRELDSVKRELDARDKELADTAEGLRIALIVVAVFAGIGFAGSVALITWTVVTRRNAAIDGKKKD